MIIIRNPDATIVRFAHSTIPKKRNNKHSKNAKTTEELLMSKTYQISMNYKINYQNTIETSWRNPLQFRVWSLVSSRTPKTQLFQWETAVLHLPRASSITRHWISSLVGVSITQEAQETTCSKCHHHTYMKTTIIISITIIMFKIKPTCTTTTITVASELTRNPT